jgi:hypothetical protein
MRTARRAGDLVCDSKSGEQTGEKTYIDILSEGRFINLRFIYNSSIFWFEQWKRVFMEIHILKKSKTKWIVQSLGAFYDSKIR